MRASGSFDVKLTPQANGEDATLGRLLIDKHYRGDLEGTGTGQMLTGTTALRDSAGYVAIERMTGTLSGRRGSFLLQHSGTMSRGQAQLTVTIVPDSGSGELAGISGTLKIDATRGTHEYELEYVLPAATP